MPVEFVRMSIVVLTTFGAYQLIGPGESAIGGILFGAALGYVVGGLIARRLRRTIGAIEEEAHRHSAGELLAGSFGGLALGGFASLIGIVAVGLLPGRWGWPVFALVVWLGAATGYRIARHKSAEILSLAGLHVRPLTAGGEGSEDAVLVDTSVLMDGRLLDLAHSGFLRPNLVVPRFVLDELQGLADSSDSIVRRKGRRGLEILDALRGEGRMRVQVGNDECPEVEDVDAKLVALAGRHGLPVMTNDHALARIAEVQGVSCLHLNRLAQTLQPVFLAGDLVRVQITQEGMKPGEGIGFLEDGSRVVASDTAGLIGEEVSVRITSSVRTQSGRMFFASLVDC